ncbi:hypothetical protein D3C81_1777310 [compost metagenome]
MALANCASGTTAKVLLDAKAWCSAEVALPMLNEPLVLFFTLSNSNTLPGVTPSAFSI